MIGPIRRDGSGRARLVTIGRRLSDAVDGLDFGAPSACVYNPLVHARGPAEQYLKRFGRGRRDVIFVGMNPGPYGMAQTGVPFGEVASVREFLGIEGRVDRPANEHPKRPIDGFACPRSEVSGRRLWSWVADRWGSADAFFARAFVWNFCPLVFMEASGRNVTPDKLAAAERGPLFDACDDALSAVMETMRPTHMIGVGGFALKRIEAVLASRPPRGMGRPATGTILHPSPASPAANRGWAPQVDVQADALGI
ncbi:MAG: uracil-DNA glycosylase family protein [Phycisphaerales bacterium]